jgi:AcrR family transcriptional regulator
VSHTAGDLRVRRTQKLLREALIALIEERGFEAITVGEIAERAMVSRAAFYRHYQDKYDLVEKVYEEMLATVAREIDPLRHAVIIRLNGQPGAERWAELFRQALEMQRAPAPYVTLFEHVAQHERLYRALLGKRGSSRFVTRMRASLADLLGERLQALASALGSRQIAESRVFADGFVPTLLAAQLVDAITWWLEQGRPYTVGQIATYWYRLMCSTLREVSGWA